MKTLQNDHYAYRVIWSEEDNEHVGLCTEFPGLSWLANSPEDALQGIREVVAEVIEDMQQAGEPVPEPVASKQYSGKFMVRVPPEVHRKLALEAAESGVSLNRLASARLSNFEGTVACLTRENEHCSPKQGRSRNFCTYDNIRSDGTVRVVNKVRKNSKGY